MQDSLMEQGINLMIFGMGTVFVFLTLLVFCTYFMSRFITRFLPEQEPEATIPKSQSATSASISPTTLKVIEAAVAAHKNR